MVTAHTQPVAILTRMFRRMCVALSLALAGTLTANAQAIAPLVVTSPTLVDGQPIPRQHTPDGENRSPALAWSGAPASTRSFALVCDDPDVAMPQPFVHWVVYNVPASARGVPAALPIEPDVPMPPSITGAVQGLSGFRRPIYRGPAPPPGKVHHYHFAVFALDVDGLPAGLTKAQLVEAMQGHVVAQGELVATYERKPPAQR